MRYVRPVPCVALLLAGLAAGCGTPTDKFMAERPKIGASVALLVTRELTDYPLLSAEKLAEDYVLPGLEAAFTEARTIDDRKKLKPGELLVLARVAVQRDELPHYIQHVSAVSLTLADRTGSQIASAKGEGVARSGTVSPSSFLIFYPVAWVLKLFTDPSARSSSQSEAIEWAVYDAIRALYAKRDIIERAARAAAAPATAALSGPLRQ